MGQTANFAATPRNTIVDISAANTNRDGTGTIVSAFTAGASGARIERIDVKGVNVTTSGMVRAFKRVTAGAWKLWREYPVDPITPSATTATFTVRDDDIGEILTAGMEVGFSTHNAEAFVVHTSGGDF